MPFRPRRSSAPLGLAALLIVAFALAFAPPLEAQVVSDPRIAEFDPSPDHWTILDDGQPAVVGYELNLYVVGAPAPFATVDMGKPSPAVDGKIRYDFSNGGGGLAASRRRIRSPRERGRPGRRSAQRPVEHVHVQRLPFVHVFTEHRVREGAGRRR